METKGITYLGIDGGGTCCFARIQDENGRLLGEAGSGPATTRIGVENHGGPSWTPLKQQRHRLD